MDDQKQFIGVGWQFPIEFNPVTKNVVLLSGEDVIKNSLDVLFATNAGERIMQPDYGSDLSDFVFENLSKSAITYMQAIISDAILFYEPRIILNDVEIEPMLSDPARIEIRIDYTISSTNNRYNYVYPYYLKEATNLTR
jgi:uncharacterized protein